MSLMVSLRESAGFRFHARRWFRSNWAVSVVQERRRRDRTHPVEVRDGDQVCVLADVLPSAHATGPVADRHGVVKTAAVKTDLDMLHREVNTELDMIQTEFKTDVEELRTDLSELLRTEIETVRTDIETTTSLIDSLALD